MGFKLPMNLFNGEAEEAEREVQEELAGQPPVNPVSQALSTSLLSLSVLVVYEFDEPIAEISEMIRYMQAVFDAVASRNPLFSCIMVIVIDLLLMLV